MVRAAEIYAALRNRGEPIGDADILIGASALTHGFGVVTNNEAHFSRIVAFMSTTGSSRRRAHPRRRRARPNLGCFGFVQLFTSSRRAADHAPGFPAASLARTRHHIRRVGSPPIVVCDAVTVWLAVSGAVKLSESSIWMV